MTGIKPITAPNADSVGADLLLEPVFGWRATVLLNARPELTGVGNRGDIVALAVIGA